ncbi:alpha/beta fold hydrolase [Amycolatopsis sp. CA-230715]|uniref:alpha/beta fold hydrolase n=1 Tax=Amycolatopsis sp. CA-230715 TaxID=2745196 RepID=UPI001C322527|nr:alpha/beta hydrolase [Amycolatopsis sp. CA-230715]QWF81193.1 4,5:9,10-diseco-3-hydroxy-5,9,17-trioxoandrosta-1(10),2-diene-4-oate hydrolase [Amycolatopsis sp. CA-230715]
MIEVDGGELYYETRGSGSPVVLVHGGSLDASMWDGQVALLEGARTVIRYDLRGHGRSSSPGAAFSHHEDLRQLLDALDVPVADVVGLSLGGQIAIDFAIAHPGRVGKLLLAAPGISGKPFRDPFILENLAELGAAKDRGEHERAVEHILRMWVDGPHRTSEQVDPAVRAFCRALNLASVTRPEGAGHGFATEFGAAHRIGELRAETLLLVGTLDCADMLGSAELIDREAARVRKHVLPGVGHMLNLEAPAGFNRLLSGFLR